MSTSWPKQWPKKILSDTSRRPPGIAAFQGAIKEWVRSQTSSLTDSQIKQLGHTYQSTQHLKALKTLTKPSVSAITQLQSSHAPLNNYLFKHQQRTDPAGKCKTGVKTADHFLFICPKYASQRESLIQYPIVSRSSRLRRVYQTQKRTPL